MDALEMIFPQIIELYNVDEKEYREGPGWYTGHFSFWLRLYAIPGKYYDQYPDGKLLTREDAKIIQLAQDTFFGNFFFLKPGIEAEQAQQIALALERASRIYWIHERQDFHKISVVKNPRTYQPLHQCLLKMLRGHIYDSRNKADVEKLAEYFSMFCCSNQVILKELAIDYYYATKVASESRNSWSDD
ncbi:MAG: hypothetical protein NTZ42_01040 [Candidatus Gribaldobacteria bacterium]|nr:hypothetical protein [Candidatus Gribaldobacteria bacterium]